MDIQKILKRYNINLKNKHIIIGVSGGPDSMCLLYILNGLKNRLNLKLDVCHINYKLRGLNSDEDEKLVKKVCKELFISAHFANFNKNDIKKPNENLLREFRYEFFEKIRSKLKADFIAAAHNADDQAETIIMKFLRGASLKGLSGMEIKSGYIIRPLLYSKRKDILDYLKKNKIGFRIDKTNLESDYLRNKIRNNLIPLLENEYNSNIKDTLTRNSEVIRNIYIFIRDYANLLLSEIAQEKNGFTEIDYKKWTGLPEALKYETLRMLIEKKLGGLTDINYAQIKDVINMLKNRIPFGKKNIAGGLLIQEKYDKIIIGR